MPITLFWSLRRKIYDMIFFTIGYVNNLPVDIMREMIGPKGTVIAVDVQSDWTFAGDDYGDYLNGWWYLFMWLNPWVETPKIPTSSDIQTQLAYISSVQVKEQVLYVYHCISTVDYAS